MTMQCNAVFKGGGAKGIAYAGALQACEESGIEFCEAAGSSAGAITATLVACGYTAREIVDVMPEALAAIDDVPRSLMMVGRRSSLLENRRLHRWLTDAIAAKVAPDHEDEDAPACTFHDVFARTGKKLYVVTLDLGTRQPKVFSPDLTPDSPVADAVVASSAIPVAFPASRMEYDGEIHRLVDGGTWANYPAFVFNDPDFRRRHELDVPDCPTIGFILDLEAPEQPGDDAVDPDGADADRHDPGPRPTRGGRLIGDKGSSTEQLGLIGAIISWPAFRWTVALVPLLFSLLAVSWLRSELSGPDGLIAAAPESLHDPISVVAVTLLAATILLAVVVSFVMMRFGGTLLDTGIVGASAAMGVGPSVPYWVGHTSETSENPDHIVVRIPVPRELSTLHFRPSHELRDRARLAGLDETRRCLRTVPGLPNPPEVSDATSCEAAASPTSPIRRVWMVVRWLLGQLERRRLVRAGALFYALVGGTNAAFNAMHGFSEGKLLVPLGWLVMVGTAVAVGIWLLAYVRRREATGTEPYRYLSRIPTFGLWSIAAVSLMLFGVGTDDFISYLSEDRSALTALTAETIDGTVVNVDDDAYDVEIELRRTDGLSGLEVEYVSELLSGRIAVRGGDAPPADLGGDLVGARIVECDAPPPLEGQRRQPIGFDLGSRCLRFLSVNDYEVGETVTIGYDTDEDLYFLRSDIDADLARRSALSGYFVVALVVLGIAFRSIRTARWKSQNGRTRRSAADAVDAPRIAPKIAIASAPAASVRSDEPEGGEVGDRDRHARRLDEPVVAQRS